MVLRCHPTNESTHPAISPPIQQTRTVQFEKVKGRISAPKDSSGTSSSGISSSDESGSDEDDSSSTLGAVLDGANDSLPRPSDFMPFGGDASWDNTGQDWNDGGQGSWQRQGNSQQWNDAPATKNSPNAGHGPAASGQLISQVSLPCNFSGEYPTNGSKPSHASNVHHSTPRSNNSSKRSRHSSGTQEIPHVPNLNTTWAAQQAVQPSTVSPAVLVNVFQSGAPIPANMQSSNSNALPPPVKKQSPNGSTDSSSDQSGSKHSGSNNDGEANEYNDTYVFSDP